MTTFIAPKNLDMKPLEDALKGFDLTCVQLPMQAFQHMKEGDDDNIIQFTGISYLVPPLNGWIFGGLTELELERRPDWPEFIRPKKPDTNSFLSQSTYGQIIAKTVQDKYKKTHPDVTGYFDYQCPNWYYTCCAEGGFVEELPIPQSVVLHAAVEVALEDGYAGQLNGVYTEQLDDFIVYTLTDIHRIDIDEALNLYKEYVQGGGEGLLPDVAQLDGRVDDPSGLEDVIGHLADLRRRTSL